MAINKAMKLALKALSYPDIDLKKNYKLHRTVKNVKAPHVMRKYYHMWDCNICVDNLQVPVRIYDSYAKESSTVLLFIHGGGWVTENVDTYNRVCIQLSKHTGCKVVSIEYRLAPEHPFPQGLEDCYAVAKELICHPEALGEQVNRVVLIGDSAGGNLCAAVSLMARDRGEFEVREQILIYPATYGDYTENSPFPSVEENGKDYLLTSKRIQDYMELYLAGQPEQDNPYFAPLKAENLALLPRTLVMTAQYDPLRDEGEAFAKALHQAGNDVKLYQMKDALHGFFALDSHYVHVKRAYQMINRFLAGEEDNHGGKS